MKKGVFILLAVLGILMIGCPQTVSVTIRFDANGGKGTMTEMVVESGVEITLSGNAFTKEGSKFVSWNEKKDGKGKSYSDKAKVTPVADMVLYAQWKEEKTLLTFPKMTVSDIFHASEGQLVTLLFKTDAPLPEELKLNITKEGLTEASMIAIQPAAGSQTDYGIGIGYGAEESAFSPLGEWRVRFEHPDYQSMTEDLVWTAVAPAAPQDFTATAGDGSVTLSWAAPEEPVTQLYLTITPNGAEPFFVPTEISAGTTGVTLTDLTTGVSYMIAAFFGKNGFYNQSNSATANVFLPKIPTEIVRGDKKFVLVKGFDFNAAGGTPQDNVEILSNLNDFTHGNNLFVKGGNASQKKGQIENDFLKFDNGSSTEYTGYKFSITSDASSTVVYAEIKAKVENTNNLSIGFATKTRDSGEPLGWGYAVLYGKDCQTWKVGNYSTNGYANISPAVQNNKLSSFGVYFPGESRAINVTYYANGGNGISLPYNDAELNNALLQNQTSYWMSLGADSIPGQTLQANTCYIDYVAFYAEAPAAE